MEYGTVITRLDRGDAPPDLVLAVDGFNDVVFSVMRTALRGPSDQPVLENGEDTIAYNLDPPSLEPYGGVDLVASDTAARYRQVQDLLDARARAVGSATAYFFQPDAMRSEAQLRDFGRLTGLSPSDVMTSDVARVLDAVPGLLAPRTHDLRPLFDDRDEAVFVGPVHTNEEGARIVAAEVARVMGTRWQRLAGRGS